MDDRKKICDAWGMTEVAVETRMDALRKRLVKAVKVDGVVTYQDLSEAIGKNPTFVQQFVTKKSPKRLYDEHYDKIVSILDAKGRASSETPTGAPGAENPHLRQAFERLVKYPALHDKVISYVEFEIHRYETEREKATKPAS